MTVIGWRRLAIVLLVVFALLAVQVYANWALIVTAYKNRKVIGDAGAVAGGVASIGDLVGDVRNIFGGKS